MIIKYQPVKDEIPDDLQPHPLAELFPMMDDNAFKEFAGDIKEQGQREPIILFEGKILDGRNRFKACKALGIDPRFEQYQGNDALGFVISLNLRRRHLTESQRAMVAGRLANVSRGGDRRSESFNQTANLPNDTAAKILNVSERSVRTAKQVHATGTPELVKAVETGEMAVSAAATLAKYPEQIQNEVLIEKDVKRLAKAVKDLKQAQELHALAKALPKPEKLSDDEQTSLAEALGTRDQRGLVMTVLKIGEQVAELPAPEMFIDLVPPAYERTINDEIQSLEGVLRWFDAFLKAWKAKE